MQHDEHDDLQRYAGVLRPLAEPVRARRIARPEVPLVRSYIERTDLGREELGALAQREATTGSVLRLEQSGGAGYGSPFKRAVERVLEDVHNGYVSVEAARNDYGVFIDPDTLRVDAARTEALRAAG